MKLLFIISYFCVATITFADSLNEIREKAEKGDAAAQNSLGEAYQNGLKGVNSDQRKAFLWFKKSAEQGDPNGQSNLAFMYYNGRGVAENKQEAVRWYITAAEHGHTYAQINLGICYRDGGGVAKNDVEAYKWFLLSAAQGDLSAKHSAEELEATLSQTQRAEGQKRAEKFVPKKHWKVLRK
jgi:TPR repeat protein